MSKKFISCGAILKSISENKGITFIGTHTMYVSRVQKRMRRVKGAAIFTIEVTPDDKKIPSLLLQFQQPRILAEFNRVRLLADGITIRYINGGPPITTLEDYTLTKAILEAIIELSGETVADMVEQDKYLVITTDKFPNGIYTELMNLSELECESLNGKCEIPDHMYSDSTFKLCGNCLVKFIRKTKMENRNG